MYPNINISECPAGSRGKAVILTTVRQIFVGLLDSKGKCETQTVAFFPGEISGQVRYVNYKFTSFGVTPVISYLK